MSLLVVAYNPSIDEEWHLDDLVWDEKNLIQFQRSWAGGKGVNVVRWLNFLGEKARLLLAQGGSAGRELIGFLKSDGLVSRGVNLACSTRRNVLVTLRDGRQLRFNSPGPKVSAVEAGRFLTYARKAMKGAGTMIMSGSLPAGVTAGTYAELIRMATREKCRVLLDCDGEALRFAVPAGPFLIKPNEFELSQWWGRRITNLSDSLRAAKAMSRASGGWVMVSRGANPSVLTHAGEGLAWIGVAPRVKALNTLGAGDAMLAGAAFEILRGSLPLQWLKTGMASGTSATLVRPGLLPSRRVFKEIRNKVEVTPRAG